MPIRVLKSEHMYVCVYVCVILFKKPLSGANACAEIKSYTCMCVCVWFHHTKPRYVRVCVCVCVVFIRHGTSKNGFCKNGFCKNEEFRGAFSKNERNNNAFKVCKIRRLMHVHQKCLRITYAIFCFLKYVICCRA